MKKPRPGCRGFSGNYTVFNGLMVFYLEDVNVMVGRYPVVTLCGITRFKNEFMDAQKSYRFLSKKIDYFFSTVKTAFFSKMPIANPIFINNGMFS